MERAQRTHTEEFYEVVPFSLEVATLNQDLLAWEHTCHTVRPHRALGYLTPHQYLLQGHQGRNSFSPAPAPPHPDEVKAWNPKGVPTRRRALMSRYPPLTQEGGHLTPTERRPSVTDHLDEDTRLTAYS